MTGYVGLGQALPGKFRLC